VLCVREEISKQYLDQINIRDNVHVTIDSAFMNAVNMEENEAVLNEYKELKEFLVSYDKVVGLTITDFKWHVKYNKDKDLLNRIEDTFYRYIGQLTQNGYGVLFIPQLFGNQNDYNYMDKYSCMHTFIMDDMLDANFQQYVISKLYAVVGMRYHSNIFSAKMGTPFIAIVYEEKMEGFLELAQLSDYAISLLDLSIDRLNKKFNILEKNHKIIRVNLQKNINGWRKNAQRTVELFTSINLLDNKHNHIINNIILITSSSVISNLL
jgi:colanic acid/amylovoran biosynthesis protein